MKIGGIVLIIGMICTLIAILPLFFKNLDLPSIWWFLSMLSGVGVALILLGLRSSSRVRSSPK